LPRLRDGGAALSETYQRIHNIVGVGPTLGFTASGHAAREVENVLLPAYRAGRGLDLPEIDRLSAMLEVLRATAKRELQAMADLS
jgi:hypothetical protein